MPHRNVLLIWKNLFQRFPKARRRRNPWLSTAAEVQQLEARTLLSGNPAAQAAAIDLVRYDSGSVVPNVTQAPPGYSPAQIKQAYGFNQISFNGTAGDGTGTTIAIIDAYDDPNIASDLHQFDLAFGLPDPPSFIKESQTGSTTSLPAVNSGWVTEIALDVEWAHAIAPGAKILLIEANSNNFSDLFAAVYEAETTPGVNVVSMSWGGSEFSGEQYYDSYFVTPNGHVGVTYVASSGDTGAPTQSPSSSPNVVSVGGTTLNLGTGGNWSSETGWGGSGGGISTYESQPSYQHGIVTQTTAFRADPDVAYDADPNTGFGVYDSYNNGTTNPWGQWGGTSDAAPQWAALIAIADQGRAVAGESSLDGATQTLPMLYSMAASDFHDITSGNSGGSPSYSAGPGYDLVTGRGSPYANRVVNDLVGVSVAAPPTLTTISTLGIAAPQVPFSISYATLLADSDAHDSNSAAIQFYINGVQNGTLTITHNGVTTAVVAGTTLFGTGDSLTWTGPAGVTGSAVNAFTVTAYDGVFSSSSAVQVTMHVQALPTLTTISTLVIAAPQVPFSISYATLLADSNAQDSNGAAIQFYINGVQNGTLTITHNGVTMAVVAGTTLFGTGDSLTWTGPAGVTGSAVNSFTVTAFDGVFSSSSAVQVTMHVQALPTLTTISTLGIAAPQVPFSISYATLLADSNAQDSNSAAIQFYINGVQNGTLTITHNGVTTAVVAGTTLLGTGDSLTWTGPAGVTGSAVNAFTVTAYDGSLSSSTPVQVTIHVQALPTLTTISTLGIAAPQVPFSISYATLLADSNALDFNSAPIQFRINGVQNGALTITHNGVTTAVVAGTTLFGTGDSLTWTGPAGVTGSAVNAFTVTAYDGVFSSSSAVQVTMHVQALPTLTTISTLGIAAPQVPFSISYATLLADSNAQDSNS